MSKANGSALTGAELTHYWEQHYPGCPLLAICYARSSLTNWFRIHTLPDAKRYAESDHERSEILHRHNTLLSSLLGDGERYVLITTGYSENLEPIRSYQMLETLVGSTEEWFTVPLHELEAEDTPNYWRFFFSAKTWKTDSMDELLKLVADGIISNVLFLSMDRHCLYHPYDGGADVFVQSYSWNNSLRQEYRSWLSSHPEGL